MTKGLLKVYLHVHSNVQYMVILRSFNIVQFFLFEIYLKGKCIKIFQLNFFSS